MTKALSNNCSSSSEIARKVGRRFRDPMVDILWLLMVHLKVVQLGTKFLTKYSSRYMIDGKYEDTHIRNRMKYD